MLTTLGYFTVALFFIGGGASTYGLLKVFNDK